MKHHKTLAALTFALVGAAMLTTACQSEREHHGSKHEEHGDREHGDKEHSDKEHSDKENGGKEYADKEQGEKHEQADKEDAAEMKITLAEAPEAVRNAIAKLAPGASVGQVERATEDGRTTFEIEYTNGNDKVTVSLTDTGELLEMERAAPNLPDAVKKAIEHAMPGAKIKRAESIQIYMYEVVVEKDGKSQEIKVAPNGEMDEEGND